MLGSMAVQDLIRLCSADGNAPEWPLLWSVIESATRGLVRQQLYSNHLDKSFRGDILQDLFLHLQKNAFRRLKIFHGVSEAQFKSFAYTVGRRFTLHWIHKDHQSKHHEAQAIPDRPKADLFPAKLGVTQQCDNHETLKSWENRVVNPGTRY